MNQITQPIEIKAVERRVRTIEETLVSNPNSEAAQRVLEACRRISWRWQKQSIEQEEVQDE